MTSITCITWCEARFACCPLGIELTHVCKTLAHEILKAHIQRGKIGPKSGVLRALHPNPSAQKTQCTYACSVSTRRGAKLRALCAQAACKGCTQKAVKTSPQTAVGRTFLYPPFPHILSQYLRTRRRTCSYDACTPFAHAKPRRHSASVTSNPSFAVRARGALNLRHVFVKPCGEKCCGC